MATHSSGFKLLLGSLPVNCLTFSCAESIRVEPPTRSTLLNSEAVIPASFSAFCTGIAVLSIKSLVSSSNLALVRFISRCFGPSLVAVMNGRLILVVVAEESSFFAFSAASFNLWSAILSPERSTPSVFLNSSIIHWVIRLSKSSPPRCVSPLVARTSITPSPISMMETSNVPPPKSYTMIFCSFSLSRPYASAAAVGSLIILFTSRPAILPASLVAWRCASLK